MRKNQTISDFFLHYGISTVLILMLLGTCYLLQTIEISNKLNVDIYIDPRNEYYVYLPHNRNIDVQERSLLPVSIQNEATLLFEIVQIKIETSYTVCRVIPKDNEDTLRRNFENNTKLSGYVFANKIKLSDLMFNKWINR